MAIRFRVYFSQLLSHYPVSAKSVYILSKEFCDQDDPRVAPGQGRNEVGTTIGLSTTSQDQLKKFEMIIKIILTRLKVLSGGKLMLLLQPEIHLIGIKFIEQLNIYKHYVEYKKYRWC